MRWLGAGVLATRSVGELKNATELEQRAEDEADGRADDDDDRPDEGQPFALAGHRAGASVSP